MIYPFIRIALIACHVFIQILWTATSRGENFQGFLKTWRHIKSAPIVIFELIGFIQVIALPWIALPQIIAPPLFMQILGLILSLIGIALASWAKIIMGTNWGRPAQHDKQKQSSLVITGPFAYTRNPIYVGLLTLLIGQQIALGSSGILLAIPFFMAIDKSVATEEALLAKYFGKAYLHYKNRVRRYI